MPNSAQKVVPNNSQSDIPEDNVLTDAINQTEDWVRERIFKFNGVSLDDMMALESNCMHREREIKRA